jgi:hypothetical protein
MTWAEFQIRLFAYNRMQKKLDWRAREIAYAALTGFHSNPKKMPKTKETFWPIEFDKKVSKISEAQKQAFLEANQQYLIDLKNLKK